MSQDRGDIRYVPMLPVARTRLRVNLRLTNDASLSRVRVRLTDSAFRHGIAEADILHAFRNAVRLVEIEQYGEERLVVIGPDRAGHWLELVAMPAHDAGRIIPADGSSTSS
ncbi:hypothetical protein NF556_10810 [Ornithinimicrobium faecis]|uniref:Uncharacterized protein n=1 Tax=Ornithinimicrobium faecis TaxID=2934158 RepID=A0ABY4YP64_9MICO|nr:hypothetical protein [Ornithinimicrobium sp. HY1793]USQ78153.1 hypothetical protein NF556_10810 [Ornithinimicrobium sp. HY1793]